MKKKKGLLQWAFGSIGLRQSYVWNALCREGLIVASEKMEHLPNYSLTQVATPCILGSTTTLTPLLGTEQKQKHKSTKTCIY